MIRLACVIGWAPSGLVNMIGHRKIRTNPLRALAQHTTLNNCYGQKVLRLGDVCVCVCVCIIKAIWLKPRQELHFLHDTLMCYTYKPKTTTFPIPDYTQLHACAVTTVWKHTAPSLPTHWPHASNLRDCVARWCIFSQCDMQPITSSRLTCFTCSHRHTTVASLELWG